MEYAQGDVFRPVFAEPYAVTAVTIQIMRLSDGLWLDWNDLAFKNTGWTTKAQALVEDDDGIWSYVTGWAVPGGFDAYLPVYLDQTGNTYAGDVLQVGRKVAGAVVADGGNTASSFKTDLPATADDHYDYAFALFRTGNLAGQVRPVTTPGSFTAATGFLSTAAFTETPGDGDEFEVINH